MRDYPQENDKRFRLTVTPTDADPLLFSVEAENWTGDKDVTFFQPIFDEHSLKWRDHLVCRAETHNGYGSCKGTPTPNGAIVRIKWEAK